MAKHVSEKIKISQADLDKTTKALGIDIPIYEASKRGRTITIVTRHGIQTYTIPRLKRPEPKPVISTSVGKKQGKGKKVRT
jgi:hypothetical protein